MGSEAGSCPAWTAQIEELDCVLSGCQQQTAILLGAVEEVQCLGCPIFIQASVDLVHVFRG